MSLLADALQHLMVSGIFHVRGRAHPTTIAEMLTSPRAAYDLDFDDGARAMLFDFRVPDPIAGVTAADCSRLACSAFQTVVTIGDDVAGRDALPWGVIKLYYAAFYAGHTIIRLLGDACSFFDQRHVARIDAFAKAIGKTPGFPLNAGLYRCAVDPTGTKLTCTRIGGLAGGSHEAFWGVFGELIRNATGNVLEGPLVPSDAQTVFAQLEAFDRLIRRYGTYAWLSNLRNELQYRQSYEVWYPTNVGRRDRQMLSRLAVQWAIDPMSIDLDTVRFGVLGEFIAACSFIVAACRILLMRIAERAPRGSFLQFGPIAFLNNARFL